ncbi:MAG: 5'-methylthioadenosine/adenosylhomocysteine nucleosidase [Eubacterium sp.]|nr:5'-methylthioadenosine/adenosylhomocysteine nucleosidase [Eubacterium sp.]
MESPFFEDTLHRRIRVRQEDRKNRIRKDLVRYGYDVLQSEEMKKAFEQTHHLWSTVGEHTVRVAFSSVMICYALRKLRIKVNLPIVIVGALCHDLGIVGREEKYSSRLECSREHPKDSVEIAGEILDDLPDETRDVIERHMWPIGRSKAPNSLEGFIVSLADKYNSVKDLVKGSEVNHTGVKNYVRDKKEKVKGAPAYMMNKYRNTKNKRKTKTGIIGALEDEVSTLKEAMTDKKITVLAGMEFCEGKLDGKDVVVVRCNIGKVNAGICAQLLISDFGAGRIINTGVAGSLDARINIGDIVVSTDALQHDFDTTPLGSEPGEMPTIGARCFPADGEMRLRAANAVKESVPNIQVFEGRICTGDQFIASREKKEAILSVFGGLCCEMEGGAIAQVCYLNHTPFVIIRAISDKADDSEEVSFMEFAESAARRCAAITRYMICHEED